jgi:hypothetical protein
MPDHRLIESVAIHLLGLPLALKLTVIASVAVLPAASRAVTVIRF